ncbi:hypothetical protein RFI_10983 [Reticulomyxa filosa]|uniref:Uncharacterized protein n=1 Tax=Reticulomyxa filosa TaxID=46433 RepID=X6NK91_RETFI|nr:hypothetical protein RFI_10983 [Reticulomyxa filosa]|eukprot:ETO26154.1 hypothetical protein RFI_10983 [Reticulomyxa filosa]
MNINTCFHCLFNWDLIQILIKNLSERKIQMYWSGRQNNEQPTLNLFIALLEQAFTNQSNGKGETMTQTPVKTENISSEVASLVQKQSLTDIDGNALTIISIRPLEKERKEIYSAVISDLNEGEVVVCECKPSDNLEDGDLVERIIVVKLDEKECNNIITECKISLDEFPPSGLVEYTFDEKADKARWYLSQMCLASLEHYKGNRFRLWKEMIEKPDCKATFRRLLRIGVINRMFDHVAFPSPDHEKADWEVKNDSGKIVIMPRPIQGLRQWNVSKRAYDQISPLLPGAPTDSEKEEYWKAMLVKFKEQHGEQEIADLLNDKKTEEKEDA